MSGAIYIDGVQERLIFSSSIILLNGYAVAASFTLAYIFFTRYGLEQFILPKLWGKTYTNLSAFDKRSFTSHHLWLCVKLGVANAAIPLIKCLFLGAELISCGLSVSEPCFPGSSVTNADWLSVCWFGILAMFAFELVYRLKVSPVSTIHHTAGICLGIWQISGDLDVDIPAEGINAWLASNDSQFLLIMMYGAFEILFETYPHFAVILYRHYKGQYRTCAKIWGISAFGSVVGSLGELICVAVYMRLNWYKWSTSLKIAMPILHFAFMAAQLHAIRVTFNMSRGFLKKAKAQEEAANGSESALPELTMNQDQVAHESKEKL